MSQSKLDRITKALATTPSTKKQTHWKGKSWKQCNLGSGYLLPTSITRQDWEFLLSHYEKLLNNSGFHDIELRSSEGTGFFSALFNKEHNSARHNRDMNASSSDIIARFNYETLDYHRYLSLFYHHAPRSAYNQRHYWAWRYLLRLKIEGFSYPEIMQHIRKAPRRTKAVPRTRSIYWAHYHVSRIDIAVMNWVRSKPEVLMEEWEPSAFEEENYENGYGQQD